MRILRYALMIAAAFTFAGLISCSDDGGNGVDNAKIGFEETTYSFDETAGLQRIAFVVTGEPKGYPISFDIQVSSVDGSKPDSLVRFTQTDNLKYQGDTLAPVFVEMNVLDNKKKEGDKSFTLTIVNVKGATISNASTTVTIVDNETTPYDRLQGNYTFTATNGFSGETVSFPVKISSGYSAAEQEFYSGKKILVCWGMNGLQNETPSSQNFSHQPEWYLGVSESAGELQYMSQQQMTDPGTFKVTTNGSTFADATGYLMTFAYTTSLSSANIPGTWSDDYNVITFDPDYAMAIMLAYDDATTGKTKLSGYFTILAECKMTRVK